MKLLEIIINHVVIYVLLHFVSADKKAFINEGFFERAL